MACNVHRSLRRNPLAVSRADVLSTLGCTILLLIVITPSLAWIRLGSRGAVCSSNLRKIGQGMHIYANDNQEWFPIHYFRGDHWSGELPIETGVRYEGMMGSTEELRINQPTSPEVSPYASHPSRSLFLLIRLFRDDERISAADFVCPSSGDTVDNLSGDDPYGPEFSTPERNRYDFHGYDNLSYAYQLPYSRRGKPRETLDVRMPIAADKGPYYQGDQNDPGALSATVHDERSSVDPPYEWYDFSLYEILDLTDEWRRYNSRNHGGVGQNVLYVDAHVEFADRPNVGVNMDNIYTVFDSYLDLRGIIIGAIGDYPDETYGPAAQTDSFLVP